MVYAKVLLLISVIALSESANILGVFLTPSYSHQIFFQPIWRELSKRGHQVTVVTPNPLNDPTLTNLTEIDMSSSYLITNGENRTSELDDNSATSELARLKQWYRNLTEHTLSDPRVQKLIKDKTTSFDLFMVEFLYPSMYFFKDLCDCPMVGVTSLSLTGFGHEMIGNPNNPIVHSNILLPFSSDLTFSQKILSIMYDIFTKYLYQVLMNELDELIPLYVKEKIRPIREICQDFSLVIVNSNLAMYNARPFVPNLIDISGMHITKPKSLPKDLKDYLDDAKEGVIYFSLGSNTKSSEIPKEQLDAIVEAFSEIPYKILWKVENETLTRNLPNIKKMSWFPQQDVLAHPNIKLFITQGGIQSLDEAIFKKVPVLMIPLFVDQRFNSDHMVKRGGGLSIELDQITKKVFKDLIEEVIKNPKYRENMKTLSAIATDHPMPPIDRAVWWIEYVIRHKGASHLMYAGRDIPFYQFFMLDIIGFFILILSIVLVISFLIFKKISALFSFSISNNLKHQKLKET